jgi:hypothetical protein
MQTIKLCPIAVELPSTTACAGVSRTAIIEAAMMALEGSGSRGMQGPQQHFKRLLQPGICCPVCVRAVTSGILPFLTTSVRVLGSYNDG